MKPRSAPLHCRLPPHIPRRPFSASPSRSLLPQCRSSTVDVVGALALCGGDGRLRLGASLHASIVKNSPLYDGSVNPRHSLLVWNSLLSMYFKCGQFSDAAMVFDEMPLEDTVSWNTMMSVQFRSRDFGSGLGFFKRMRQLGVHRFSKATLATLFAACDGPDLGFVGVMLHGLVFSSGFDREVLVANAVMSSYFKFGRCRDGRRVFDEMVDRSVVSWTGAISGLAQNGLWGDSLGLFLEMRGGLGNPNYSTYVSVLSSCSGLLALEAACQIHGLICKLGLESDIFIGSALMDAYAKCGSLDDAVRVFESAEQLDEVSMTVIVAGLVRNGAEEQAIRTFVKMVRQGMEVDPNTVSAILGVFQVDTPSLFGRQIHSLSVKKGFLAQPFAINGLLNMYSRCGDMKDSLKIFNEMADKNSVAFNSLIAAFARHGDGLGALQLFEDMKLEEVEPTDITFLCLLHACSHAGLVSRGMELYDSMEKVYGIIPTSEHQSCMVDLLGRAGFLEEARSFIDALPGKPGMPIWQALLGVSCLHGHSEMAKYAADMVSDLEPGSPSPYVAMSNMYSFEGKWREKEGARKGMVKRGLAKQTGVSWIEVDSSVRDSAVGG